MTRERREDQAVDAFSASRELLRAAHLEAKRRGMTKSGFYRYCLAKELGVSEEGALKVAEHAGAGQFEVMEAPRSVSYAKPKRKPRASK
ncbi:MAG: hypothetical protein PW734_04400 [Verrucomicrobium sp.]|nr:hypothetical protein [Verrucomicrobium sp.]